MRLLSVNVGVPRPSAATTPGVTGIDKRPVPGRIAVSAPGGARGSGAVGLAADLVCDVDHHGGDDQAVYAYAREDLDYWEKELERPLTNGVFGENLTTSGLDVNGALVGERWRIGEVVVEVTSCRIPCRTFAEWIKVEHWVRWFTEEARPGAYLRVIEAGGIQAGDPIEIVSRPDHDVTVGTLFRAMTTQPDRLPDTLRAGPALGALQAGLIRRRLGLV